MKAVGEVMAIGRTFPESLQKAWQSLEIGYNGLGADREDASPSEVRERLAKPLWDRTLQIRNAFKLGASVDEIADVSKVDPWFLYQIRDIVRLEEAVAERTLQEIDAEFMNRVKQYGFSDIQIAYLLNGETNEMQVREHRKALGVIPSFQVVDTCAGEFRRRRPISILRMSRVRKARCPTARKLSFWEAGRTASVRASNSITPVYMA